MWALLLQNVLHYVQGGSAAPQEHGCVCMLGPEMLVQVRVIKTCSWGYLHTTVWQNCQHANAIRLQHSNSVFLVSLLCSRTHKVRYPREPCWPLSSPRLLTLLLQYVQVSTEPLLHVLIVQLSWKAWHASEWLTSLLFHAMDLLCRATVVLILLYVKTVVKKKQWSVETKVPVWQLDLQVTCMVIFALDSVTKATST